VRWQVVSWERSPNRRKVRSCSPKPGIHSPNREGTFFAYCQVRREEFLPNPLQLGYSPRLLARLRRGKRCIPPECFELEGRGARPKKKRAAQKRSARGKDPGRRRFCGEGPGEIGDSFGVRESTPEKIGSFLQSGASTQVRRPVQCRTEKPEEKPPSSFLEAAITCGVSFQPREGRP